MKQDALNEVGGWGAGERERGLEKARAIRTTCTSPASSGWTFMHVSGSALL